jgi:hypothetical protein
MRNDEFDAIMAENYQTETFEQQIAGDWTARSTLFATLRARGVRRIVRDARDGYRMVRDSHK